MKTILFPNEYILSFVYKAGCFDTIAVLALLELIIIPWIKKPWHNFFFGPSDAIVSLTTSSSNCFSMALLLDDFCVIAYFE